MKSKKIQEAALKYAMQDRATRSELSAFVDGVLFAQRWIPVEKELPEDDRYVLIKRSEKRMILVGYYMKENNAFYFPYITSPLSGVTHWRYIEIE
jgi:hypothetical protein